MTSKPSGTTSSSEGTDSASASGKVGDAGVEVTSWADTVVIRGSTTAVAAKRRFNLGGRVLMDIDFLGGSQDAGARRCIQVLLLAEIRLLPLLMGWSRNWLIDCLLNRSGAGKCGANVRNSKALIDF